MMKMKSEAFFCINLDCNIADKSHLVYMSCIFFVSTVQSQGKSPSNIEWSGDVKYDQ